MVQISFDLATLDATEAKALVSMLDPFTKLEPRPKSKLDSFLTFRRFERLPGETTVAERIAEGTMPDISEPTPSVTVDVKVPVTEAPAAKKRNARVKAEEAAPAAAEEAAPTTEAAPAEATQASPLSVGEIRAALAALTEAQGMTVGLDLLKEFGCSRVTEVANLPADKQASFVARCNA